LSGEATPNLPSGHLRCRSPGKRSLRPKLCVGFYSFGYRFVDIEAGHMHFRMIQMDQDTWEPKFYIGNNPSELRARLLDWGVSAYETPSFPAPRSRRFCTVGHISNCERA
jgi:hypothetical protein